MGIFAHGLPTDAVGLALRCLLHVSQHDQRPDQPMDRGLVQTDHPAEISQADAGRASGKGFQDEKARTTD